MSDNLTRDTFRGFKWTYGSTFVGAALQIGHTAVMARLLAPADFGLVAMAMLFLRFGSYFAQMGVSAAIIQKPDLKEEDVRAAFWSSVLLGAFFSLLVVAAAPLAELLFDTDAVVAIVRVLALSFLVNALGITAKSLLRRDLRFRTDAIIDMTSFVVGYMAVGISGALAGWGVWSLVAAALSQALLSSVVVYAVVRHSLRPHFSRRVLAPLYSFGGRVSIISFFEFLGGSLDTLFIGRFAGPTPLGFYNRGQLLISLPLDKLTQGMSNVLFPSLSRIQSETHRLRGVYLSGVRLVAVLILPVGAGMAGAAPQLVSVLLGGRWGPAADVMPLLAVAAATNLLSLLAAVVCEATGALNRKLVLQVSHVALFATLMVLSAGQPLLVFAAAAAFAQTLRMLGLFVIMRGVIGVRLLEHGAALLPVIPVAAAIGLLTRLIGMSADALPLPEIGLLMLQVALSAVVLIGSFYVGPLTLVRRDIRQRLRNAGAIGGDAGRIGRSVERLLGSDR